MRQSAWTVVCSCVLSGIVVAMISIWNYNMLETRKAKMDTLKKVTGNMWYVVDPKKSPDASYNFHTGLNEAYVTFNDSEAVIVALKALKDKVDNDRYITLVETMCTDLHLKTSEINDSFLTTVFHPSSKNTTPQQ